MDGNALPVSPDDLYARLGTANAPLLIDVRRAQAFEADDRLIIGSARRLPDDVSDWRSALPAWAAVSSPTACTVTKSAKAWPAPCEAAAFRPPTSKAASRLGRSGSFRRAASAAQSKTNG